MNNAVIKADRKKKIQIMLSKVLLILRLEDKHFTGNYSRYLGFCNEKWCRRGVPEGDVVWILSSRSVFSFSGVIMVSSWSLGTRCKILHQDFFTKSWSEYSSVIGWVMKCVEKYNIQWDILVNSVQLRFLGLFSSIFFD